MRFPRTSLVLAWLIAFAPTIEGAQPPPLLTAEDLAALHRENALWRAVRADLDVPDFELRDQRFLRITRAAAKP